MNPTPSITTFIYFLTTSVTFGNILNMDTEKPAPASQMVLDQPLIQSKEQEPILPGKKLTVPGIATLLARGRSKAEIARIFNVSPSAVTQYCQAHADELGDLADPEDLLKFKIAHQVHRVLDSLNQHDLQNENLMVKSTHFGILFDKYRLQTGKTTQNVGTLSAICIRVDPIPLDVVSDNKQQNVSDKMGNDNNKLQ